MQEQRAAGQRVPPGGAPPAAGGDRQVERVDVHAGCAGGDHGAADGVGEAGVLVFGVDDVGLDAAVQRAQQLEFDQVGLARPGPAEDDGVVVVAGEPVPEHQRPRPEVVAVEHPTRRGRCDAERGAEPAAVPVTSVPSVASVLVRGWCREFGGGERERGGQRVGVEGAVLAEFVQPERQAGDPPVQGAVGGGVGVDEHAGGQRPHVGDPLGQFGRGGGVHGQRQPDLEQAALAAGDPVGQGVGVLGGGVGVRVG